MLRRKLMGASLTAYLALSLAPAAALSSTSDHSGHHAADHAPIGVMADHRHAKGHVMLSYRFMRMDMEGSRDGTDTLSAETIATTVPNRFFGQPMQPPTLRVVPLEMTMNMHMVGAMYGLTDRVTLMAMGNYITKSMDHVTFQGPMGTNELGNFTTEVSGFGDTTLTAIVGIDDGSRQEEQFNVNFGISLPTGSIERRDDILTPMNTTPRPRLPYPMQIGSGTYDLRPAITYRNRAGYLAWGAQVSGIFRLGENDEDYTLGDVGEATAWLGFSPNEAATGFLRLRGVTQGTIRGLDPQIVAPVQTADPNNQGGDTLEVLLGVNLAGQEGAVKGHRLAAEVGLPVYRNLNGPQLETDLTFTLGWQKAF